MTDYTMAVTCESPFEEALTAVRGGGLAEAGFGVTAEIDLSATLRQKISAAGRRHQPR